MACQKCYSLLNADRYLDLERNGFLDICRLRLNLPPRWEQTSMKSISLAFKLATIKSRTLSEFQDAYYLNGKRFKSMRKSNSWMKFEPEAESEKPSDLPNGNGIDFCPLSTWFPWFMRRIWFHLAVVFWAYWIFYDKDSLKLSSIQFLFQWQLWNAFSRERPRKLGNHSLPSM